MKYIVELTIDGSLEIEAESEQEARERVEDGYSLTDFIFERDEINDIYLAPPDIQ